MISIVIPLYNKQDYIAETLRSVLGQTYTQFEVILVDDGSSDASVDVVNTFSDARITLVEKQNEGVSIARNHGVAQAQHQWIAFLDADDWWAPTFLEEVVKGIEQYPEAAIVATGRSRVFEQETERYTHELLPKDGETELLSYFKVISKHLPLVNSSNVVLRKSLFLRAGGFRPGMRQHEDHDLWIRLCVHHQVLFINKALSFYRKNVIASGSAQVFSSEDFLQYLQDIKGVYQELSEKEKPYFSTYFHRFIAIRYFQSYGKYNKKERQALQQAVQGWTKKSLQRWMRWLSATAWVDGYRVLKKIKG
ncbi:glycosyltransferase family 2 protein [Altibacter sp. HG106]|uniref:glycosyltransferase family 2 protein n=1 Tax=Altibacter sp. HG106 TaxID=3023937 RepID=UPI002350B131|nr:glycosyltransferase family 2 protein [Altibacter sp. HG106]MDC7995361.1 glycosyltransferase family 2 protein [Altibacter sp. HG106]